MFIGDLIQEYIFDCKVRKLTTKTIEGYRRMLGYLQDYLMENYGIDQAEDVRSIHVKHYLVSMAEKGRKPQYINDLLKVYKTFFGYCAEEDYIDRNPTEKVHNVKQPKVLIRSFSEDEIRKMLNYFTGRDFLSLRNKTMIAMFFDTGMRLSEVLTLMPEQIHDEYILVHGKGNKERLVPVSPFLGKLLIQYMRTRNGYFTTVIPKPNVFVSYRGKVLTQERISEMLKEVAKAVGVRKEVRVSPHTCRHTFAHLQLKNGLDLYSLSRLMGHENIRITQRYLDGIKDDEVILAAKKTGVLAHL